MKLNYPIEVSLCGFYLEPHLLMNSIVLYQSLPNLKEEEGGGILGEFLIGKLNVDFSIRLSATEKVRNALCEAGYFQQCCM